MAVVLTGHTGTEVTTNSRSQTARCGSSSFLLRVYCSEPVLWKEFCSNDAVLTPSRCTFPLLAVSTSPSGRQKSKATEKKKKRSQSRRHGDDSTDWLARAARDVIGLLELLMRMRGPLSVQWFTDVVVNDAFQEQSWLYMFFLCHCLFILMYCFLNALSFFFSTICLLVFSYVTASHQRNYCNNTTIIHYRDIHTHIHTLNLHRYWLGYK